MNWKQHLETLLILFAVLTLGLLAGNVAFSERLIVVSLATLAMYYLMSGTLVLFDKRVGRPLRILYFVGLWSISMGLLGVIYRLRFWVNSEPLLMVATGLGAGALVVLLVMRYLMGGEQSEQLRAQLKPLFIRLLVFPALFLLALSVPNYELYQTFGAHRDSPEYIERFIQSIENPEDSLLQQQFQHYEDSLKQEP